MTNQQTETKPFRSLADQYRDQGLCECGCGREADSTIDESWTKEVALWGARITKAPGCGENWEMKVRKNRSTPAPATGGAKPVEETDEQWLKRVVYEMTGIDVVPEEWSNGCYAFAHHGLRTAAFDVRGRGRDVAALVANLRLDGWPLKSPAGVGSAASLDGGASPVSPCETEATEPAPVGATTWGIPRVEPVTKKLCREDVYCVCVYCRRRRLESDGRTWAADSSSARQRMALMDERERPRPSRWSRELERAHPWSNDDD